MPLADVVYTLAQARERLQWYVTRWQIEIYHRTPKSGCRLEQRQASGGLPGHRPGGGLAHLPLGLPLGQARPRAPRYPLQRIFFEQAQCEALVMGVHNTPSPPDEPPTLRAAMRRVASLGGFLGRKSDVHSGTQTLWLGLQRLDDLLAMYLLFTAGPDPSGAEQTVG
jgi:hypothetical protein